MRDNVHSREFWDGVEKKVTFQKQFKRPDCIILDSEYCSMGRMIAVKACETGGYAYYDAEKLMGLLKIYSMCFQIKKQVSTIYIDYTHFVL